MGTVVPTAADRGKEAAPGTAGEAAGAGARGAGERSGAGPESAWPQKRQKRPGPSLTLWHWGQTYVGETAGAGAGAWTSTTGVGLIAGGGAVWPERFGATESRADGACASRCPQVTQKRTLR
jgi:hypothetical protein